MTRFKERLKVVRKCSVEGYLPPLLHHPTCSEDLFTKDLAYTLKGAGLTPGWLGSVPAYVGHDRGVDAAATCFKNAIQMVVRHNSPNAIEAVCARLWRSDLCFTVEASEATAGLRRYCIVDLSYVNVHRLGDHPSRRKRCGIVSYARH
jgi:hypothetical protein